MESPAADFEVIYSVFIDGHLSVTRSSVDDIIDRASHYVAAPTPLLLLPLITPIEGLESCDALCAHLYFFFSSTSKGSFSSSSSFERRSFALYLYLIELR